MSDDSPGGPSHYLREGASAACDEEECGLGGDVRALVPTSYEDSRVLLAVDK